MPRFLSKAHVIRYNGVAVQLMPPGRDPMAYSVSADWAACLYLLTAHEDIWHAVAPHVNPYLRVIDWSKVRRLPLSSGQRFLVNLAQFLYNGSGKIEWDALWNTLDNINFDLAVGALQVRRHGEDIIEEAEVSGCAT